MKLSLQFSLLLLLLSACQPLGPAKLYPGPALPPEKLSVVDLDPGVSVTFYTIANKGGYMMPQPAGTSEGADVTVLPGFYKAMVTFIDHRREYDYDFTKRQPTSSVVTTVSTEPYYLEFTVKPGKSYKLNAISLSDKRWRAELVELPSNTAVSKATKLW